MGWAATPFPDRPVVGHGPIRRRVRLKSETSKAACAPLAAVIAWERPGFWEVVKGAKLMIFGAHVVLYTKDSTADRAFFREVLGFSSVDAGHGWLIFALPPAEVAVHPAEQNDRHELYFMCDDLN